MNKDIEEKVEKIIDFLTEAEPDESLPKTDAIFVFGHYDLRIAEQAAGLYFGGKAPKIILTGRSGKIHKIPANFESEAEYFADFLKKKGVPECDLILEEESTNSLENVLFGMKKAASFGFFPRSLILCAMPPLLRRSRATFKKQFPEIKVFGSAFPLGKEEWQTPARISRILGEIDRLREYAEKGDIVPTQIPLSIRRFYNEVRHLETESPSGRM
ncbi:MAG: YdcF family protein [bacterium]|nr:YdcF family protein [bacterium]